MVDLVLLLLVQDPLIQQQPKITALLVKDPVFQKIIYRLTKQDHQQAELERRKLLWFM
jgi:hypothetical protein